MLTSVGGICSQPCSAEATPKVLVQTFGVALCEGMPF